MASSRPSFVPADIILPDSIEPEKFVLGAILAAGARGGSVLYLEASRLLKPHDFSLEKNQIIFRVMGELHERESSIDSVTVRAELQKQGLDKTVGGLSYIVSLDDGMPPLVNLDDYCRIVKEKSMYRRIIHICAATMDRASEQFGNPQEIAQKLALQMLQLAQYQETGDQGLTSLIDYTDDPARLERFIEPGHTVPGIPTGFAKFDEMTGGLREGELIILAARPAFGKTGLALNIAQHVVSNHTNPKAVAVFSLEMSKESLLQRVLCATARVDMQRFRAGYINEDERQRLRVAMYQMVEHPLFVDDTAATTIGDIYTKLLRLKVTLLEQKKELGLVVVDYMQLMQGRGRFENRVQEISSLSRGFKLMSKELRVPFLVLSQLSRAPDLRPGDHRPILSDLRESGCLTGDTLIADATTGSRIPIRNVKPGTFVWALNESTFKLERAIVSASFSTGIKRVFEVKTRLGRTIKATAHHPFRTWDGWKPLNQIKRGETIAVPRSIPAVDGAASLSYEAAALLGHMIGNGCVLPRHAIQYTSGDHEICEIVKCLAKDVFGEEISPRISPERSWFQVYLPATRRLTHGVHNPIRDWLHPMGLFGKRAPEKFVPDIVFQQPATVIATFIRHLWSTDGCLWNSERHYPGIYYASSSLRLAHDLQALLLRLGINAALQPASQMSKGRPMTHVEVSGKPDMVRFCKTVGALGSRRQADMDLVLACLGAKTANTNRDIIPAKVWLDYVKPALARNGITTREMMRRLDTAYCGTSIYKQNVSRERALRLAAAIQCEAIHLLAESDLYWDKLVSVEYAGEEEVFDLTVPGHHNFVANGLIPHNSIEQDADMVAFIFREEVYRPDKDSLKGIAELILAKQRNGPTGRIKLAFLKQLTKFENLAADLGDDDGAVVPMPPAPKQQRVSPDPLPYHPSNNSDELDDEVPF